jgi:hypothetical protein
MNRPAILFVLMLSCGVSGFAQDLTIGNAYVPPLTECDGRYDPGHTDIDLTHPATAPGTILQLGFAVDGWLLPCENVVAIKFFRREGDTLTLVAERGPFSSGPNTEMFTVSPPVEVEEGDLIGITLMTDSCCILVNQGDGEYLQYEEDLALGGHVSASAGVLREGGVAIWGAGEAVSPYPALILPVVGSGSGALGSSWQTSVQLHNPHAVEVTGRLVFRRAGVPGSTADTAMPYSLSPGETQGVEDIVGAMGEHGVGSIDVVTDPEGADGLPPIVVAHIFHDRGDGGTFGLMLDALEPNDHTYECSVSFGRTIPSRVLRSGRTAFLIAPESAARARLNIGVRALNRGTRFKATIRSSAGEDLRTVIRNYPPDCLKQVTAEQLLGVPLSGGESISITVLRGSAIVYGSSIDNLTNDPTIQFASSVFVSDEE